jgi:hypothetical protein
MARMDPGAPRPAASTVSGWVEEPSTPCREPCRLTGSPAAAARQDLQLLLLQRRLGGRVGGRSGDGVEPLGHRVGVGDLGYAAARARSYAPGRRSSSATSCSVSESGSTSRSASRRASSR